MRWQHLRAGARRLLPLLAAAVLVGCGGGGDKPASVSGKVTYKGKPVTSGTVVLVGENGKNSDPGPVQPDGTYSIAHAPAGKVKVSFDNPPPQRPQVQRGAKPDPEVQEAAKDAARYVATPLDYKDPNKSGVTFDLKRGKNTDCDINLK